MITTCAGGVWVTLLGYEGAQAKKGCAPVIEPLHVHSMQGKTLCAYSYNKYGKRGEAEPQTISPFAVCFASAKVKPTWDFFFVFILTGLEVCRGHIGSWRRWQLQPEISASLKIHHRWSLLESGRFGQGAARSFTGCNKCDHWWSQTDRYLCCRIPTPTLFESLNNSLSLFTHTKTSVRPRRPYWSDRLKMIPASLQQVAFHSPLSSHTGFWSLSGSSSHFRH